MNRVLAVRNCQRACRIDTKHLRTSARRLLEDLLALPDYSLCVHLIGPTAMARINRQFLNHEGPTDVITFDLREGAGSPPLVAASSSPSSPREGRVGKGSRREFSEPKLRALSPRTEGEQDQDQNQDQEFGFSLQPSAFSLSGSWGGEIMESSTGARQPGPPLCGEIYICVEVAKRQAREFGTAWPEEILRYLVHGVLHLRGFDDLDPASRRVMKRAEGRLLRKLVGP